MTQRPSTRTPQPPCDSTMRDAIEDVFVSRIRALGVEEHRSRHATALRFPHGSMANDRLGGIYALRDLERADAASVADDFAAAADFIEERTESARIRAPLPIDSVVRDALCAGGFELELVEHVLVRRIGPDAPTLAGTAPAPGIEIREVAADATEDLNAIARAAFASFAGASRQPTEADLEFARATRSAPGAHCFAAFQDRLVLGQGLLVHPAGSAVAFLAAESTIHAARGRGVHAALIEARLRRAAESGATWAAVCVDPGSASARNMQRAGFEAAYFRGCWMRSKQPAAAAAPPLILREKDTAEPLELRLETDSPPIPTKDWLRSLQYRIHLDGVLHPVGFVRMLVGNAPNVILYGGHIGYGVDECFRGRRLAARATLLLAPLARSFGMRELWITANPANLASCRTCRRIGAEAVGVIPVPPGIDLYDRGTREVVRFRWQFEDPR